MLTSWRFFSALNSGAQRLATGNTLIAEGMPERIFEATPEKKIVWEYIRPHGNLIEEGPSRETWIFRSLKCSPDEIDSLRSLPSPIELLPEDEQANGDALESPADDDGDLEWWHALLIAASAGAAFFAAGFGVARIRTLRMRDTGARSHLTRHQHKRVLTGRSALG